MNDKQISALKMRAAGSTFKEIGDFLGVSKSRASQIYYKAARYECQGKKHNEWTDGLSLKVANALISAGFSSKEEVVEGLQSGKIGVNPMTGNGYVPGVGHHGISEILLWTGADPSNFPAIKKAIALLRAHGYEVYKA